MLLFPNAKINLGLRILRKQPDGFHDIETCMYPIPWCDALEIVKSDTFSFESTGLSINGDSDNNLVVKAYELLKKEYNLSPVKIQLHKVIPMGAGLGGGSSDAAFAIKILSSIFNLDLSPAQMRRYASEIGSDCAFFIDNIAAIATGRGELLQPIDFTLYGLKLILIKPKIHVSTAEAYAGVKPKGEEGILEEIVMDAERWKSELVNDFEKSIFPLNKQFEAIKNKLYESGVFYAAMSGSGSTIYGIYEEDDEIDTNFEGCEVQVLQL